MGPELSATILRDVAGTGDWRMTYTWQEQDADEGHLRGPTNPSATIAGVDPYEDWDKVTRPSSMAMNQDSGQPLRLMQPVYVELMSVRPGKPIHTAQDASAAAQKLLDICSESPEWIALPDETAVCLTNLSTALKVDEASLRFFVFRPENEAYNTVILRDKLPYRVLRVGLVIPFAEQARPGPPALRSPPVATVATAIIDDQIGFLNERFRATEDTTRITRVWLQGMPTFQKVSGKPTVADVGRELKPDEIDALLKSCPFEDEAYREIYPFGVPFIPSESVTASGIDFRTAQDLLDPTFIRPFGFQAGHGTHVLDLAAGYPCGTAPGERPILAVQLPKLAAAETSGARLDLFVLLGLTRILHWADTAFHDKSGNVTPISVVVNISYGFLAGPKDGSGFLEREIARLVRLRNQRNGRTIKTVVVMPSGNGYRDRTRARMTLSKDQFETVLLRLQPEDRSVSFVEIWTSRKPTLTLTIAPPIGPAVTIPLRGTGVWDWMDGPTVIGRVYVQDHDNTRRRVVIALAPTINHDRPATTAPNGAYGLTLLNTGGDDLTVDIDVQRDDTPSTFRQYGRQSYLDHPRVDLIDPETFDSVMPDPDDCPVTRSGTMSAMATSGAKDFVVVGGAFDRHAYEKAALYSASSGGLPCEIDLSAVSEETRAHPGRLATGLFSGSTAIFMGTSAAAPQVTRAIVEQIAAGGDYDLSATLDPAESFPGKDERLGAGILPFLQEPGRVARRDEL